MLRQSSDSEQGFTLIELLMAITVSGLIISALAMGFIVTMKGTAGAHDRFVESNGAQTLATYFTSDVDSADPSTVSTAAVDTGCLTPAPASTTNVLRLQWTEMTTAAQMTAFSVSYRTRQVGSNWQLVRYACSGSQNLPTTATAILSAAALADHIVVQNLYDPSSGSPYPTTATIAGRKITLQAFAALGQGETTPYSYSLSASMRTPTLVPRVASINRLDPDPTNASTVRWTVTFSEPVTGVNVAGAGSDFVLAPSGVPGASITTITGSGATYTVTANTGPGSGTFTLGLNLTDNDSIVSAVDGDKLGGTGAGNGDFTGQIYTIDRTAPAVTVNQKTVAPAQADPTATLPIVFTVTFSEPVSGFVAADVTRTGTAPGGTVTVTGSGADYEISVAGLTGDGTVTASIGAGTATDAVGNANGASTSTDNTVTYGQPPLVSSMNRVDPSPTGAATVHWTVIFNKSVTGVGTDDFVLVTTGPASGASITGVAGSGTTYTVTAGTGTYKGVLGLNLVDNDSIHDATPTPLGGPGLMNGDATGQTYAITGTVTSVELRNGGTVRTMDKDDQIVVTFSSAMAVNSFCTGWSNNANNQGPTTVVVSVTDGTGATNDSLLLTSTPCSFGAIDLGSNNYVSGGNVTFGASGTNSTMSWNATNRQLTITFGKLSTGSASGTTNAVTSSTPVYTASPSIQDSTGAAVNNSPFTLPTGAQF